MAELLSAKMFEVAALVCCRGLIGHNISGVSHDDDVDIDNIPEPVPRGVFKPVSPSGEPTYIAFDLETADLIRGDQYPQYPHITQIAAKDTKTGKYFNRYIIPQILISASAERITKIIMTGETSMVADGVPVECLPIRTALTDFSHGYASFRMCI